MDEHVLVETRRSLHAVAERLLAGPQHRAHATIRLTVTPGGFGQVRGPWRVVGTDLVGDAVRVPLRGTSEDVAAAAGIAAGEPDGLYTDHADLDGDLAVDPAAAAVIADWFARGDAALRELAPADQPVVWPEHFDLGIALDEMNYGVSPGDATHPLPYAYVSPWTPRTGPFWNAPFGALRPADELPDTATVLDFFTAGREVARAG